MFDVHSRAYRRYSNHQFLILAREVCLYFRHFEGQCRIKPHFEDLLEHLLASDCADWFNIFLDTDFVFRFIKCLSHARN